MNRKREIKLISFGAHFVFAKEWPPHTTHTFLQIRKSNGWIFHQFGKGLDDKGQRDNRH